MRNLKSTSRVAEIVSSDSGGYALTFSLPCYRPDHNEVPQDDGLQDHELEYQELDSTSPSLVGLSEFQW